MFKIIKKSKKSQARTGKLATAHGVIPTPFFMPIATKGAVKFLSSDDMRALGADILLSNTYHLHLQPGERLIERAGGLHAFMQWGRPMLTDSGGYQVFSLAGHKGAKDNLVHITERGVEFRSHIDGSRQFISPESAIGIQQKLGVDIMMCLDVCPPGGSDRRTIEHAVNMTSAWAKRCKRQLNKKGSKKRQLLFGIVQGGVFEDIRARSAHELIDIGFDGYALGGLAVGEDRADMYRILRLTTPLLPEGAPRYLMGVGRPEEILEAVRCGIDMFDCVIPTREARHGRLYQFLPNKKLGGNGFYDTISITTARFRTKHEPIHPRSALPELRSYTKAYLHHLMRTGEGLGYRLATLNNIEFYLELMRRIRSGINAKKV